MVANRVIGLMSGTSTDGLDLAYCEFKSTTSRSYSYSLLKTRFIPYSSELKEKLINAIHFNALDLLILNVEFGQIMANEVKQFIAEYKLKVDLIASHGHTVFHQPKSGISFQIGDGQSIANICEIPVIANFRTKDVLLGGQGAPLVPLGDELLFADFEACLNLGGFANISHKREGKRLAFDICPLNIVLNELSGKLGKEFDKDGEISSSGSISLDLVNNLNKLDYYSQEGPKSLGREWVLEKVFPLLEESNLSIEDQMASFTEHVIQQIIKVTSRHSKILVTGGGAKNNYLITRLSKKKEHQIIIPNKELVDYKEALIFAFLGFLRINNKINVLSTVTGASKDSSSGVIYYP